MDDTPYQPCFEFDDAKRRENIAKHGIDFSAAELFEFDTALIEDDDREDYGEIREIAVGFIGDRLHVLVFTRRTPNIRVISLRKANKREQEKYAQSFES